MISLQRRRSRSRLPRWMRDGSGAVDSRPMTDEFIRARLGYLEQALATLSSNPHRNAAAKALAEQYVATYKPDFNFISDQTFEHILKKP